jgi:hypothetical protein
MTKMTRNVLYFGTTVGPYEAGLWYDNVPQADYDTALEQGWAKEVTEDIVCGCLFVDGRAIVVREERYTSMYCQRHLADALIEPEPLVRAREQQAALKSLFDAGKDAGLIQGQ